MVGASLSDKYVSEYFMNEDSMSRSSPKLHLRDVRRWEEKRERRRRRRGIWRKISAPSVKYFSPLWSPKPQPSRSPCPAACPTLLLPALLRPPSSPAPSPESVSTFAVCPFVSRTILCNGSHFTAKRLFLLLLVPLFLLNDATLFFPSLASLSLPLSPFFCIEHYFRMSKGRRLNLGAVVF